MHDHLQTSHTGAGVYNASNTSPISDLEAFVTALKRAGKFNQLAVHERVKVVQIPLLDPLMQQSDPIIVLELPLPLSPHRPLALRPPFTPFPRVVLLFLKMKPILLNQSYVQCLSPPNITGFISQ